MMISNRFLNLVLATSTAILLLSWNVNVVDAAISYLDAFKHYPTEFFWSAPDSRRDDIMSAFGPRRFVSGRYDFHRGIDISGTTGDPILSCCDGKIYGIGGFNSGTKYLRIKSYFKDWVSFHDKKPNTKRFYVYYLHMDEFTNVKKYDVVKAGQQIGTMGKTGASIVHLHIELRIGTYCSLAYAIANPKSTCNTKDYDPHMNPGIMWKHLMPPEIGDNIPQAEHIAGECPASDYVIEMSTEDAQPNVNRVTICKNKYINGHVVEELIYVLDFDKRIGFNATTNFAIDNPETDVPHFDPVSFGRSRDRWTNFVVIPCEWVGTVTDQWFYVKIENFYFGDIKEIYFGKNYVEETSEEVPVEESEEPVWDDQYSTRQRIRNLRVGKNNKDNIKARISTRRREKTAPPASWIAENPGKSSKDYPRLEPPRFLNAKGSSAPIWVRASNGEDSDYVSNVNHLEAMQERVAANNGVQRRDSSCVSFRDDKYNCKLDPMCKFITYSETSGECIICSTEDCYGV